MTDSLAVGRLPSVQWEQQHRGWVPDVATGQKLPAKTGTIRRVLWSPLFMSQVATQLS
jgi:hypothetical protein